MKKFTFLLVAALMALSQSVNAQEDKNMFNHLGVGVGVGVLNGVNFELATPVTDYLAVRVGYAFLPSLSYKTDVDIDSDDPTIIADEVEVEGKLNKKDFKVLLDVYPFKGSSFRLTAGAYIGADKLVTARNTEPFLNPADWGTAGIKLGDYRVTSDSQGNVEADIKVAKFKPYLGIGFGRAVPKKRVSFNFDLGVQFWGSPGVWTNTKDDFGNTSYSKLTKKDVDNEDADKVFDIMEKISVCPVISFRINGRIF